MSERQPKTIQELARDAITVQDASNILGLARSFGLEVLPDLRKALETAGVYGNDAINEHPVTRLWASKLHDLANMGVSDLPRYRAALEECQRLAAGPTDEMLAILATPGRELEKP